MTSSLKQRAVATRVFNGLPQFQSIRLRRLFQPPSTTFCRFRYNACLRFCVMLSHMFPVPTGMRGNGDFGTGCQSTSGPQPAHWIAEDLRKTTDSAWSAVSLPPPHLRSSSTLYRYRPVSG